MLSLRAAADVGRPGSLSNQLRTRRFERFGRLASGFERPVSILDIGGTVAFWTQRGWAGRQGVHITTVNLQGEPSDVSNIRCLAGDATDLREFGDQSFDIAFSNSVIEHLFTFEAQMRMAAEVQRVARAFWVQTPNYWFPIEPHFHTVGWQWLPLAMRTALIQRRAFGWRGPEPIPDRARRLVEEVRLLTKREMRHLFPTATIWGERVLGFTKSWVAYRGFPEPAEPMSHPMRQPT